MLILQNQNGRWNVRRRCAGNGRQCLLFRWATGSAKRFFGTDQMTVSITTANVGPTVQDTRKYQRFSDAAQEVVSTL